MKKKSVKKTVKKPTRKRTVTRRDLDHQIPPDLVADTRQAMEDLERKGAFVEEPFHHEYDKDRYALSVASPGVSPEAPSAPASAPPEAPPTPALAETPGVPPPVAEGASGKIGEDPEFAQEAVRGSWPASRVEFPAGRETSKIEGKNHRYTRPYGG